MIKLSIIICTYQRADILEYCLESLVRQTASQDDFEVIVVDNNSTDSTKELSLSYKDKFVYFQYVTEKITGLSYARNTGFNSAKANWVAYIDDDAKVHTNYITRAFQTIENYEFDCFGGKFHPWFLYPKKKWLPKDIGLKQDIIPEVGIINEGYATGCNMLFKKTILEEFKGFNPELGMTGNKIAYGEETELQDKIRVAGYIIGYDPELKIDHLVGKHKLTLKWHLKSAFAYGRDNYRMWRHDNISVTYFCKTIIISLFAFPKLFLRSIFKKNYYWQNAFLDSLKPIYLAFGEYVESKK